MEEEVIEEYSSSLKDLTMNSKPLINMLTMLAEDNEQFASQIVQVIESHINQVESPKKLPAMYLIDSIIKNLPTSTYPSLFAHNIASTFCHVFEKVDEKTRQNLYKLRQTWNEIFPNRKLYTIDVRVNLIDPAWPITAKAPTEASIHVNPKFLAKKEEEVVDPEPAPQSEPKEVEVQMRQQLMAKQELLLMQKKLEMELLETRAKLEAQEKINKEHESLLQQTQGPSVPSTSAPKPRDPRVTARDPRLLSRDPRLSAKPSGPPTVTSQAGFQQPPISSIAGQAPVAVTVPTDGSMGMSMPAPFPAIPPMLPPMMPGPPHSMMNHPPPMFPPFMPMNRPPPQPPIPPVNTTSAPAIFTGPITTDDNRNQSESKSSSGKFHSKDSRKSSHEHFSRSDSDLKSRDSDSHGRGRHESRSSRSRDSNKDRRDDSRNGKEKRDTKTSKSKDDRSKDSKSRDSKSGRKSSPKREHGSDRDSKSRETREDTDRKKKRHDSDEEKRKVRESDEDSNQSARLERQKPKEEKKQENKEEGRETRSSKRNSKEKSPVKKERSRSPVSRSPVTRSKTAGRQLDKQPSNEKPKVIKENEKEAVEVEKPKDETMEEKEEKRPILQAGYKIPKKEPSAENQSTGDDRDERMHSSVLQNREGSPVKQAMPRGNSKRDLSEMEAGSTDTLAGGSQNKKVKLEEGVTSKLDEDLSELFGGEDKDYRSMMDIDQRAGGQQTPNQKGWAQYKADRPVEFAYELEHQGKRDTDHRSGMDTDHRSPLDMDHGRMEDLDLRSGMQGRGYDRRGIKEEVHLGDVPNALSLENREMIFEQIEKRRKSGELSYQQQQDLLRELSKLDVIQKKQKEIEEMKRRKGGSPPREELWPSRAKDGAPRDWDKRLGPSQNPRDRDGPQGNWNQHQRREDGPGPYYRDGPHDVREDQPRPRRVPLLDRDGRRNDEFFGDIEHNRDRHYNRDGPLNRDGPKRNEMHNRDGPFNRDGRDGSFDRDGPHREGPYKRDGPHFTRDGPPDWDGPPNRDGPFSHRNPQYDPRDDRSKDRGMQHNRFGPNKRGGGPPGRFPRDRPSGPVDGPPEHWRENWQGNDRDRFGPTDNDYRSPRADFNENSQEQWDGPPELRREFNRRERPGNQRGPPQPEMKGSPLKVNVDRVPGNEFGWRGPVMEDFEKTKRGRQGTPPQGESDRFRGPPRDRDDRESRGPHEDMDFRKPNFNDDRDSFHGERGRFRGRGGRGRGRGGRDFDGRERYEDRPRGPRGNRNSPSFDQSNNERRDEREQNLSLKVAKNKGHQIQNEDPRWFNLSGMHGSENIEEFVIDFVPYAVKTGAPPRVVKVGNKPFSIYADPNERCIKVNGHPVYNFGDYIRDVMIEGQSYKVFYHGSPRLLWIDAFMHELRLDAPPKTIHIKDKEHTIKIDGRDGMILLDNKELGKFGGEPRFVFIDDNRCELRFDPPPRQILIDGNLCELKLDQKIPCVMINNVPHGIRFDGPPRAIRVNGEKYMVDMDRPRKIRVNNRPHFIAFGGPAHEIIFDGKWFEVKFGGPPKNINIGNRNIEIRLDGPPPDVKILDPITDESLMTPVNNLGLGTNAPTLPQGPMPVRPGPPGERPMMPMAPDQLRPPIPASVPGPMMGGPSGPSMMPAGPMGPGVPQPPGTQAGQIPSLMSINPVPTSSMMVTQEGPVPGVMIPPQQPQPIVFSTPTSLPGMGIPPTISAPGLPSAVSNILAPVQAAPPSGPLDVSSLLQKLLATGLISKPEGSAPEATPKEDKEKEEKAKMPVIKSTKIEAVPDLLELKTDELKKQHKGVVQRMYCGIQCTTCGMRFTSQQTDRYREHLDWHFRQNKKENQGSKITKNRSWFYSMNEWIEFEEIDESEDRVRSQVFEQEKTGQGSSQNQPVFPVPEGSDIEHSPAATGDDRCEICGDPFEQYFDDEEEVWHLKDAIKSDGKIYHPVCFEDEREGSIIESTPTPTPSKSSENNPLIMQIKKELGQLPQDTKIKYDDSMIVKPKPKLEEEFPMESQMSEVEKKEEPVRKIEVKVEPQESVKLEPSQDVIAETEKTKDNLPSQDNKAEETESKAESDVKDKIQGKEISESKMEESDVKKEET